MNQIRITNLRSLVDTGHVDVRPITLLVGRNSSGKSTFLRFFPLLRQSAETRTKGPILWYGDLVDFGDFDDALRNGSENEEIQFGFTFPLSGNDEAPSGRRLSRSRPILLADAEVRLSLRLVKDQRDGTTYCSGVTVELFGQRAEIGFSRDGIVDTFFANGLNVLGTPARFHQMNRGGLVPVVIELSRSHGSEDEVDLFPPEHRGRGALASAFAEAARDMFHANTKAAALRRLFQQVALGPEHLMLERIRSCVADDDLRLDPEINVVADSDKFAVLRDFVLAKAIPDLLLVADSYLMRLSKNIRYIGPFRASAERYYRTQALAVEEVDYEGRNLAMFLQSLTEDERRHFQEWTANHFGLSVSTKLGGGHLSLRVTDLQSKAEFNLADTGFGLSQVLPVLAQLWSMIFRRGRRPFGHRGPMILAIEQPELHLHPSLQAQLADVFLSTVRTARQYRIDLRLVIETHSEAIINRIGNRIYHESIDETLASVVVFEGGGGDGTRLRMSSYDDEGFLKDWPFGFFQPDPIVDDIEEHGNTGETDAD